MRTFIDLVSSLEGSSPFSLHLSPEEVRWLYASDVDIRPAADESSQVQGTQFYQRLHFDRTAGRYRCVIAILAAMLLPALHEAKYKAKLVVDMNNFKQLGIGAFQYTADNSGYWPHRTNNDNVGGGYIDECTDIQSNNGTPYDDRQLFDPYMPLDELMNCVFAPKPAPYMSGTNLQWIELNIEFWTGWQMAPDETRPKMIGQKATFAGETFSVLASDFDLQNVYPWCSHPDRWTGLLQEMYFEPPCCMLYIRYNKVTLSDPRLAKVPYESSATNFPSDHMQLPAD